MVFQPNQVNGLLSLNPVWWAQLELQRVTPNPWVFHRIQVQLELSS